MTLTLAIHGCELLDNGAPAAFRLERHGAIIGRSAHADWSLPDPKNHISARHCEIGYREGRYLLTDRSTNGTFVNGSSERLAAPYPIADGDRIRIGPYELVAATDGAVAAAAAPRVRWSDDDALPPAEAAPAGWGASPSVTRRDPGGTGAPVSLPFAGGHWDMAAPLEAASAWSSDARDLEPPSAAQIWGELAGAGEEVARPAPALPDVDEGAWGGVLRFADEAETDPAPPASSRPDETVRGDGIAVAVLGRMVAGIVRLVEARARAKAELAMASTTIELAGNNPLKFIRSPERALEALLAPPQPGFMSAERAVDDAFADIEKHELATMSAMRAALEATVRDLRPQAIRDRAEEGGGWTTGRLPRLLAEARLWRRYVRDFEGVVAGADEGFIDRFEKNFRREYVRAEGGEARRRA